MALKLIDRKVQQLRDGEYIKLKKIGILYFGKVSKRVLNIEDGDCIF